MIWQNYKCSLVEQVVLKFEHKMEEEVIILEEIISIYKKYWKVVNEMGTISMSPKDEQRLKELEKELESIRQK